MLSELCVSNKNYDVKSHLGTTTCYQEFCVTRLLVLKRVAAVLLLLYQKREPRAKGCFVIVVVVVLFCLFVCFLFTFCLNCSLLLVATNLVKSNRVKSPIINHYGERVYLRSYEVFVVVQTKECTPLEFDHHLIFITGKQSVHVRNVYLIFIIRESSPYTLETDLHLIFIRRKMV